MPAQGRAPLPALWRWPRALWRLARAALHFFHGMAVLAWRFPSLDEAGRQQRIAWFGGKMLRLLGLQVECHGRARPGATLLIANHISWLDIAAIHAACPQARFVSKADIRHWPLVGWLANGVGTLFIVRERKRDAVRVVHEMGAALQRGETVAIFPEGTTGAGRQVLPFHANLLQAAISTETPVQPVLLRYSQPGRPVSPAAEYIDEMTLLESIWRVISADGLRVDVRFLSAQGSRHADRRALSQALHDELEHELQRDMARASTGVVGQPLP
ncbi:MAG TPA: lysophospholipid acyltransferase family protein [Ideonella sp.]|nr:lysophospholipid acyltransferase family protein [Ideonella sp.]